MTDTSDYPGSLTTGQVADALHVHQETVRRWIRERNLYAFRAGESGYHRIPQEELDRLIYQRGRRRLPAEQGAVCVDPAQRRAELRHVSPDREQTERLFNVHGRDRLKLIPLEVTTELVVNPISQPVRGSLWAAVLKTPGDDAAPFWLGEMQLAGPAAIFGLLDGAPAPTATAPKWGALQLYRPDEVIDQISFDGPESDDKGATKGKSTKPGRTS